MRYLLSLLFLAILLSNLMAQSESPKDSSQLIMTIRGFNYLKSDSVTNGTKLNNPEILDTIVTFLNANPNIKVALHYHGSCNGSSKTYWDKLTKIQAANCKSYLISKGIDENRVKAIGFGINYLINDCKCRECSEEELYENQRLEVVKTY